MKRIVLILTSIFTILMFIQYSVFSKGTVGNEGKAIMVFYKPFQNYFKEELKTPRFASATCVGPSPIMPGDKVYCPPPRIELLQKDNPLNKKSIVFIAIASLPSEIIKQSKDQIIELPKGSFDGEIFAFTKQILFNLNGISTQSRNILNSSSFKVYAVKNGKKANELIFYLIRK